MSRIGGVYGTTSKDNHVNADRHHRPARIVEAIRARKPGFPICAIAGINAGNAADGDCRRRRRRGGDFGTVARAGSEQAAAQELRAVVDGALAQRGAA